MKKRKSPKQDKEEEDDIEEEATRRGGARGRRVAVRANNRTSHGDSDEAGCLATNMLSSSDN